MAVQGSPNGTKKETFNQLDEQFQVLDHHDPDIIFPAEYEMIKEIRAQRPELVCCLVIAPSSDTHASLGERNRQIPYCILVRT
jgi:hypothetical protein